MSSRTRKILNDILLFTIAIFLIALVLMITKARGSSAMPILVTHNPKPPAEAYKYSMYHDGPFEVAKVFGRSPACQNEDGDFIKTVSDASVTAGIDPRISASVIVVESGCNPFAVSSRGAIGLMQVMAKTWKDKFDFAGDVNLLNSRDNIRVGTKILAELVDKYGSSDGVRRYNGLGVDCSSCDAGYTGKVMAMAGRN